MFKRFIFTIIVACCVAKNTLHASQQTPKINRQMSDPERDWLELKIAIKNGDLTKVKTIVPDKIDINAKTNTDGSLFDLAAGNNEIYAYLMKHLTGSLIESDADIPRDLSLLHHSLMQLDFHIKV